MKNTTPVANSVSSPHSHMHANDERVLAMQQEPPPCIVTFLCGDQFNRTSSIDASMLHNTNHPAGPHVHTPSLKGACIDRTILLENKTEHQQVILPSSAAKQVVVPGPLLPQPPNEVTTVDLPLLRHLCVWN
mmetsp:Transcript_20733/g.34517  ORF Transcript_20733/g.34517 Transcript_20733/m.34517 type:complete len:132 (+) Transcript_20733:76-471(+)